MIHKICFFHSKSIKLGSKLLFNKHSLKTNLFLVFWFNNEKFITYKSRLYYNS